MHNRMLQTKLFKTNNNKTKLHCIFTLITLLIGMYAFAGKRYWIGNGTNKNWNATTNWSTASGGSGGAAVPVSTDSVYFDNGGTGQCMINATVNIKLLTIGVNYTDTIKQNTFVMTVTGMILNGGKFWGGSNNLTVNGPFTLTGTQFSAPVYLQISGNFDYSGGSFLHNNGTVKFTSAQTINGNINFYNLEFYGNGAIVTINDTNILTAENTLIFSGGGILRLIGGQIHAKGNILQSNLCGNNGTHTTVVVINGSNDQYFYGQTNPVNATSGWMPDMKIDKPSGTLYLKDYIAIRRKWEVITGTVDALTYTSTLSFPVGATGGGVGGNITGKKNQQFNNILIATYGAYTHTFTATDTIEVRGTLTTYGAGSVLINGYVNAKGNITLMSTATLGGGTGTIHINGSGNQTITGTDLANTGKLCNITINKSDTLKLKKIISIAGNLNHINGVIDAVTDSSTVAFCGGNHTIHNPYPFYNVAFIATGGFCINTISAADTVTVLAQLTLSGTSLLTIQSGTINAKGNITVSSTSAANDVQTGRINICGTGNQTLKGSGISNQGQLCSIIVNKPSGTLLLSSIITLKNGRWDYIRGTVDPGTSTLCSAGSIINGGTASSFMSFYNFFVFNTTTSLAGVLGVKNTLTIDAIRILNGNSYPIYVAGQWNNLGTFNPGNSTVILNGTGDQTVYHSSQEIFYSLKIDKPSGKVRLTKPVTLLGSLNLVEGIIVTTSTNLLSMPDNATLTGGSNLSYVAGPLRKTGNDAFTFPLGDTTLPDTSAYHPFSITAPSSTADSYTAQYYAKNQLVDHATFTTVQSSLKSISTCEYWSLTRNAGTSVVLPTLNWNKNSCNTGLPAELRVGGWDGSQWKNMGQTALTGTAAQGSITAVSPGINTTNQYYTLGLLPHLVAFNTQGLDTLSLPDTLKYTMSGGGLTGTYVVGGIQNLYPNLPATGTVSQLVIHLSTNSGQSVDIGIELTPSGVIQNPHVIVPIGGPSQPPCSIFGCLDLGTAIKINECIVKNCLHLSSTVYAVLKRELDGGYFQIINGDFRFKFDEEYNKSTGKLSYRLYTDTHKLLLNTQALPAGSQYNSAYGSNYFAISLLACYDNVALGAGYYIIEVENEKREVWTARLKNVPQGQQPACQSGGGGIEQ